jgi:hypothetical protein
MRPSQGVRDGGRVASGDRTHGTGRGAITAPQRWHKSELSHLSYFLP